MDTYTKEDLEVRPWNQAQSINWNGISLLDVRRIIRSWLQTPALRPQNPSVTWDDYEDLGLVRIKARVTELDWPEGLRMVQYSELETAAFLNRKRKRNWLTLKLIASEEKEMNLSVSRSAVRQKLQDYLSMFSKCHVYGFRPLDSSTSFYRILVFDKGATQPPSNRHIILVHYNDTEYFLLSGPEQSRTFVEQAIVAVFGAADIKQQPLSSNSLDALGKIIINRASLGVFGQFRYLQRDPVHNPLNFGRLSSPAMPVVPDRKSNASDNDTVNNGDNNSSDDEHDQHSAMPPSEADEAAAYHYPKFTFVTTREQKRRIIPIQQDKMNQRYDSVEQVFGNYPLDGLESLNLKLEMSVEPVLSEHGIQIRTEDEETEKVKVTTDDDPIGDFFLGDTSSKQKKDSTDNFLNDDTMVDELHESDKADSEDGDNDDSDHDEDPFAEPDGNDPDTLTMKIKLKGQNVMAGLRDLALHGYIDPPYPSWMTELVASGSSQAYITKDSLCFDEESASTEVKK